MAASKEPNAEALAAFIARKAEIDRLLEQLLAHSHEHLNLEPEEVHWGHVPSWTTGWPACGGWRSWQGCWDWTSCRAAVPEPGQAFPGSVAEPADLRRGRPASDRRWPPPAGDQM